MHSGVLKVERVEVSRADAAEGSRGIPGVGGRPPDQRYLPKGVHHLEQSEEDLCERAQVGASALDLREQVGELAERRGRLGAMHELGDVSLVPRRDERRCPELLGQGRADGWSCTHRGWSRARLPDATGELSGATLDHKIQSAQDRALNRQEGPS